MDNVNIPIRIAKTLLNALKGGVVPRIGLGYITVGRKDEVNALLNDVNTIQDGGAAFRFVVGKYGAGKSFLLQAIRNHAMEKNFVVIDADFSPERRLSGNKGEGLATYKELMKNLSTKTAPDGGALNLLLQKWISTIKIETMKKHQIPSDNTTLNSLVEIQIRQTLNDIQGMVGGFNFAKIILLYWKSTIENDEELKNKTLKWLRGEYTTKTEAKNELGIGVIISDDDWYEYVKLFALFVVKAGYKGILMLIDELVNIYKIPNSVSRQYNYEKILTIYNDIMQGKAQYLGVIMGGTPQCIEDSRRGVFSYEALKSRLESSRFSGESTIDLLSPIIKLKTLGPTEMYVLIEKLEEIHGQVHGYKTNLSSEELDFFIKSEYSRIGAEQNITPREIIRDFIEVLNIILQNPQKTIKDILESSNFSYSMSENDGEEISEAFKGFEI